MPVNKITSEISSQETLAVIGIGANLGDREGMICSAWEVLGRQAGVRLVRLSRLRETEPVGGPPQPDYLNGAGLIAVTISAEKLLDILLGIEAQFGRVRTVRWGARTLDLDLLLYGQERIETDRLSVPHPRLLERRFALEPAAEIAPDFYYPGHFSNGPRTLRQLAQEAGWTESND